MLVIMGAAPNDCIILVIHQTGGGGGAHAVGSAAQALLHLPPRA